MAAAQQLCLERDPFARTVDPADAFESQAFVAARDGILRELAAGARLIALVGAAGTGKTLLLRAVEAALARQGRQVRRLDRGDLIADAPHGDALLIDEADRMTDAALLALAQAVADPSHPAVVLALTRRRLDHLGLPVAARSVTLDELGSSDARDFILDRIERAGGEPSLFSPGAIGALTYVAAGSPRLLRLLASGALFQASQDGAPRVEMAHARRAIAVQRGAAGDLPAEPPVPIAAAEPVRPTPVVVSPRAERAVDAAPGRVPETAALPVSLPIVEQPAPEPKLVLDQPESVASQIEAAHPAASRWSLFAGAAAALLALAGGAYLWQVGEPSRAPTAHPTSAAPVEASRSAISPQATTVAEQKAANPAPEPQPEPEPQPQVAAAPPTAIAEPPAATPAEPEPPRVVVRYAGGQPGAADAAGRIADLLRARGFEVAEVRAAPGRIRQASIRYAPGERRAGEAVNTAFETVLRAYQPGAASQATPSAEGDDARGTIEVWVPDSAAGASRPLRTDAPPS